MFFNCSAEFKALCERPEETASVLCYEFTYDQNEFTVIFENSLPTHGVYLVSAELKFAGIVLWRSMWGSQLGRENRTRFHSLTSSKLLLRH